jgi:hypothetical protein
MALCCAALLEVDAQRSYDLATHTLGSDGSVSILGDNQNTAGAAPVTNSTFCRSCCGNNQPAVVLRLLCYSGCLPT